jgi:hypothetical protein
MALWDLLEQEFESHKNTKVSWRPVHNEQSNILEEALSGEYIGSAIKKRVLSLSKKTSTVVASICGTKVVVTMPAGMQLRVALDILAFTVRVLTKLNGRRSLLRVILMPVRTLKRLPNKPGMVVGVDEVNSGYAWKVPGRGDHCTIVVYRKEDLNKVLIHELVHCWDLDFKGYDPRIDRLFIARYNLHLHEKGAANPFNKLALNEAFTEVIACFLHAAVYVLFTATVGGDNREAALAKVLKKEGRHYIDVAAKVMAYLATPGAAQGTHVFAYYVCKAAMFQNLEGFFNVLRQPTESAIEFLSGALSDFELPKRDPKDFLGASIAMTQIRWQSVR